MASATGLPALFWSVAWIAIAIGILVVTMRLYVSSRKKQFQLDLDRPFEQIPAVFPATIHTSQNVR
jgi:hypothetical protein